ncbi:von Willebrand factor D and EGF domain-containing protein-like [Rhineura floridana]|uniref:von Willebrand factor D and EGF domain-containing protein-like n=1 Tax=Rhineura floridana TaxID=261503 RepID=UPI002AC806D9|nr:von Willebrand factor D and EGF domain-containing protein-like [Rhineura floridana]
MPAKRQLQPGQDSRLTACGARAMGWHVVAAHRAPKLQLLPPPLCLLFLACVGGPLLARALPSKASRGVAVPFVFDPHAVCSPPCQHGGLCIRNSTCFCSKGYEGELCQYATCYPKCKNGGKCLRPGKCRCQPGYGGRYCHKVSCEGGCQNSGECISVNGVVKCLCASGWTGSRCQEAVCPQGCRNGAACVAPGICSCATGWVGGACHLALCRLPCHHGGKCIAPDVCRCRSPYSGIQCTKKIKK